MSRQPRHHVSVSARTYAALSTAARERGVSISALVDLALGAVPVVDAAVVEVPLALYVAVGRRARKQWRPMSEVLEAAIVRALDDAERWPDRPRKLRRPMVAHARVMRSAEEMSR